jgi:hypothetical protein
MPLPSSFFFIRSPGKYLVVHIMKLVIMQSSWFPCYLIPLILLCTLFSNILSFILIFSIRGGGVGRIWRRWKNESRL